MNSNDYFSQNSLNNSEADLRTHAAASQISGSIDNLSYQLRRMNDEQKIYQLELEIAKATDPRVQRQLQHMLDRVQDEIDRRRKRQTIAALVMLTVLVAGGLWFYRFSGLWPKLLSGTTTVQPATSISSVDLSDMEKPLMFNSQGELVEVGASAGWYSDETSVDLMNLTSDQLKDWVKRAMLYQGAADAQLIDDGVHSRIQVQVNHKGEAEAVLYLPSEANDYMKLATVYRVKDNGTLVADPNGAGNEYIVATGWNDFELLPYDQ